MTYCWKCPQCGYADDGQVQFYCPADGALMRRDYRSEAVGIGSGVRMSRTGTVRDQAQLFLPDNSEFAGPGDPDGKKGAREWLDTHQAKESGGYNPLLEIERKSF